MSSVAKKFFIASLIYLILGLATQAVTAFDLWLGFNPLAYTIVAATEKILLLGWLTQLALALVYESWLRPGSSGQAQVQPPKLMPTIFILFNIGLPLVILGQPILARVGGSWVGFLAALGGLFQLLAGLLFLREVKEWLRIKPR